jgi:hypothetical protein
MLEIMTVIHKLYVPRNLSEIQNAMSIPRLVLAEAILMTIPVMSAKQTYNLLPKYHGLLANDLHLGLCFMEDKTQKTTLNRLQNQTCRIIG